MKTYRHIRSALVGWFTLTASISLPAENPKLGADTAELNSIAKKAYLVFHEVPTIGLEKSVGGLEQIIATHHRLAQDTGVAQQHLSLVLADAVAFAIVSEIYRAERTRLGLNQNMRPPPNPPRAGPSG